MIKNSKLVVLIILSFVLFFSIVNIFSFKKIISNENYDTSLMKVDLVKNGSGFSGLEFGHTGRVWVNDLSGTSNVYRGDGEIVTTKDGNGNFLPLAVLMEGTPIGQVFSPEHSFLDDAFIFTTLEGKIFGWHKDKVTNLEPFTATLRVDNSSNSASYTGITTKKVEGIYRIYVADNYNNKIEMYDEEYSLIEFQNSFVDIDLPSNFSVFNIKEIDGYIYVTYKNKNQGGGIINIFDEDGKFVKRLITNEKLNKPFGIAKTPESYGNISDMLLVGNVGDGKINVFDSKTGEYKTTIKSTDGKFKKQDLILPGLQALTFGTNNGAGRSTELFFTTATDSSGIFGKLNLIVEDRNIANSKEKPESIINEEDVVEKDFLEQNSTKISYEDFKQNLNENCLEESCLDKKLKDKTEELKNTYNKIFTDGDIIINELVKQKIDVLKIEKLENFLNVLEKQNLSKWEEYSKNECNIYALNFYSGASLENAVDTCMLYKTENWLKELYTLRSIYIRVEMSPVGSLSGISKELLSDEFNDLVDQEEDRVEKSY